MSPADLGPEEAGTDAEDLAPTDLGGDGGPPSSVELLRIADCQMSTGVCRVTCRSIRDVLRHATGIEWIDPDGVDRGDDPYRAFCVQGADGGGWALALKVDGASPRFRYSSPLWATRETYNPDSLDLTPVEARLQTWDNFGFTDLRIVMQTPGPTERDTISRAVVLTNWGTRNSLFNRLSGGRRVAAVGVGRDEWLALRPGAPEAFQLHAGCVFEGFNLDDAPGMRQRIGIAADDDGDCYRFRSRIGVGGEGVGCEDPSAPTAGENTAGNAATCFADDGGLGRVRDVRAFAFVFVR